MAASQNLHVFWDGKWSDRCNPERAPDGQKTDWDLGLDALEKRKMHDSNVDRTRIIQPVACHFTKPPCPTKLI